MRKRHFDTKRDGYYIDQEKTQGFFPDHRIGNSEYGRWKAYMLTYVERFRRAIIPPSAGLMMCLRIPLRAGSYYRRARMGEMQGQSPEEYRSVHGNVREDFRRATTPQITRYRAPPPDFWSSRGLPGRKYEVDDVLL